MQTYPDFKKLQVLLDELTQRYRKLENFENSDRRSNLF